MTVTEASRFSDLRDVTDSLHLGVGECVERCHWPLVTGGVKKRGKLFQHGHTHITHSLNGGFHCLFLHTTIIIITITDH